MNVTVSDVVPPTSLWCSWLWNDRKSMGLSVLPTSWKGCPAHIVKTLCHVESTKCACEHKRFLLLYTLSEIPFERLELDTLSERPFEMLELDTLSETPFERLELDTLTEIPFKRLELDTLSEIPFKRLELDTLSETPFKMSSHAPHLI